MTRSKLFLFIAAICCSLLSLPVHSQELSGKLGLLARVGETEFDVKTHELELKLAELEVAEAKVELEKVKLHLEAARKQEDSREVGHLELELKQAAIGVEMRQLQTEMARLQIERARARLRHVRAALTEKSGKPSVVQVEYLDDLGVIIIRGEEADVEKIKALLGGKKNKKQRE